MGKNGKKAGLDLLQFLATASIPFMVLAVGLYFNYVLEQQRTQDEVLEAYADDISDLARDEAWQEDPDSEEGQRVRQLAQAKTAAILSKSDAQHKGEVVRVLYSQGLIQGAEGPPRPRPAFRGGPEPPPRLPSRSSNKALVDLRSTDLRGADLSGADLPRVDLSGVALEDANLQGANLRYAHLVRGYLRGAKLNNAVLSRANLRAADVGGADFTGAVLDGVYLKDASLEGADFTGAVLEGADLREAILPEGLTQEQLQAAYGVDEATQRSETFGLPQMVVVLGMLVLLMLLAGAVIWRVHRTPQTRLK